MTGMLRGEAGRGGRPDVARALSDAWGAHVAVLDASGCILEVNGAWQRFGLANGGAGAGQGDDYFAVCEAAAAAEPTAAVVVDGLRALAAGHVDDFRVEYPCHSPEVQRWFRLTAKRLLEGDELELLVIHEDVSESRHIQGGRRPTLNERVSTGRGTTQQLRAITDTIHDGVCTLDGRGRITYVNPAARRVPGPSGRPSRGPR